LFAGLVLRLEAVEVGLVEVALAEVVVELAPGGVALVQAVVQVLVERTKHCITLSEIQKMFKLVPTFFIHKLQHKLL